MSFYGMAGMLMAVRCKGNAPQPCAVGYVYDGVYQQTNRFGYSGNGVVITGSRTRQDVTLWQEYKQTLGYWDARSQGFGGWTLGELHAYVRQAKRSILGMGDNAVLRICPGC